MGKSKKKDKKSEKKPKHKKHKEKKKAKKSKRSRDEKKIVKTPPKSEEPEVVEDFSIPVELMNSKSHAPETPAEYEKRQSHIRRVTDPVTGRVRLIKGDGEVLEEIVTKERHKDINRTATQGDGHYFEEQTVGSNRASRKRK